MTPNASNQLQEESTPLSVFQQPLWRAVFALFAATLWGCAFPLVKIGFNEFSIAADMTASKMLYAGVRFTFAGILVLAFARLTKRDFSVRSWSDGWFIVAFALINTTLHYTFFYVGMSHCEGARGAILNAMGVFILVLAACMFFKSDTLTRGKALGCLVGATGIVMLHVDKGGGSGFTWMGDGMMMINALCSACGGLMTRSLSKRVDIFVGTGYNLFLGGALLCGYGVIAGGTLPSITPKGCYVLTALVAISTIGFMLYNKLLTCNPIGKVAIYNSLIPIVGTLTSCWCLDEPFRTNYTVAAVLATVGIYLVNREKGRHPKRKAS